MMTSARARELELAELRLSQSEHDRLKLQTISVPLVQAQLSPQLRSIAVYDVPSLILRLFGESTLERHFSLEEKEILLASYKEQLELACMYFKISPIHSRTLRVVNPYENWNDLSEYLLTRSDLETFLLNYCGIELSQDDHQAVPSSVSVLPAFDTSAETYPVELDWALKAWFTLKDLPPTGRSPKQELMLWLKKHAPSLSREQIERIATVANWNKRGGAPRTP